MPLGGAICGSSAILPLVIAVRSVTIMGLRLALLGTVLPAAAILTVTLVAAVHPHLQGILITGSGLAAFVAAMLLMPKMKQANKPGAPLEAKEAPTPETSGGEV